MDTDKLYINNAYKIQSKEKIKEILVDLFIKDICFKFDNRTLNSFIKEWITNNKLQKINKKRKDYCFKSKQSTLKRIFCSIMSIGG